MAAITDERKRTCDIRLRLTEDVYRRLSALADRIGMPPSTLACYAVGEYVKRNEDQVRATQMGIMRMAQDMGEKIGGVELMELASAAIPAVLEAQIRAEQRQEGGGEKTADQ